MKFKKKNLTTSILILLIFGFFYFSFFKPSLVYAQAWRSKYYSVVIIAEEGKKIVADYTYSDPNMVVAMHHKGFAQKFADKTIFIPRFLKKVNYGTGEFNSSIAIMNTEDKSTDVIVQFYERSGQLKTEIRKNLGPFSKWGLWALADIMMSLPGGYEYSVKITSTNTNIVADSEMRNLSNQDGGQIGGGFEGIPLKRLRSFYHIPIIVRNAFGIGWESSITFQNPNNTGISVKVELTGGNPKITRACSYNIPPLGQKEIYFPSDSCFNPTNSPLPDGIYIAQIRETSASTKVAVIYSLYSRSHRMSIIENASDDFSMDKTLFVPRMYNNYAGSWNSSFLLANFLDKDIDAKVTYISNNIGERTTPNNSCGFIKIPKLSSQVVYIPYNSGQGCIPAGDVLYAGVVQTNDVITGVYHGASRKQDVAYNRGHGASLFSLQEADRIYFIPRFYYFSYGWQSGIVIQNAEGNSSNNFTLYILNDEGRILVRKERKLQPYQATHYYSADDFRELEIEPTPGSNPPIPPSVTPIPTHTPTPTPTNTPTPTRTPTPTPTPTTEPTPTNVPGCECVPSENAPVSGGGWFVCASNNCPVNLTANRFPEIHYTSPTVCSLVSSINMPTPPFIQERSLWCNRPLRPKGDADGQNGINHLDYFYYLRAVLRGPLPTTVNPDFSGDGRVDTDDLVIWERSRSRPQ